VAAAQGLERLVQCFDIAAGALLVQRCHESFLFAMPAILPKPVLIPDMVYLGLVVVAEILLSSTHARCTGSCDGLDPY